MRTARLHGVGDLRVADEPMPAAAPGMCLLRVTAVGICGSDLHWYAEAGIGDARLHAPLVVGHEFAGVIEGGPRHGTRVAVDPAIPCRRCPSCLAGHRNLCPAVRFAGHGDQDGALREYLAWPEELLHPLPDALSDTDGAMLEPLGVALHALDLGHTRAGDTVGVVGAGPIGLLLLQVARAAGATRTVVVEPLAHRRAAALAMGADLAVPPDPGAVAQAAGTGGLDVVFEAAGTDLAVELAMVAARPGARVVLAGIPGDDRTAFPAGLARRKGLTILLVRRMKDMYPRTIALVAAGRVDVTGVVSHRYPLDQVGTAFRTAAARTGLKVVVSPS